MSNPTLSTQEAVGRWREKLAELEHDQWIKWSKDLAIKEILTQDRLKRWLKLWQTPYSKLTEKEKDQDRVWADKVLKILVKELSAAYERGRKDREEELTESALNKTNPDYLPTFYNLKKKDIRGKMRVNIDLRRLKSSFPTQKGLND